MSNELADIQKLEFLREILIQEQHFFWARFSSFAAMNAGLFVLATSTAVADVTTATSINPHEALKAAAFILSVVWFLVQWVSLYYVSRWKPEFHTLRQSYGIVPKRHWLFSQLGVSATGLGVFVTIVVSVLWGILLFG